MVRAAADDAEREQRTEPTVADLVRAGLTASPKTLPALLLYDARGSRLFERICELEEYYVTRTERALLETYAGEIAASCPDGAVFVELGSGSSEKTELLLERVPDGSTYVPVDISESALRGAVERLARRLPRLHLRPVVATYDRAVEQVLPALPRPVVLVFLGSNLGNLGAGEAHSLLSAARTASGPGARLLLGLDLVKPLEVLLPAYDDRELVTAEFDLNVLYRINRELGADFFPSAFAHEARWNPSARRVEMHLRSLIDQHVRVEALDLEVAFAAGETIHTESSHKYTRATTAELAGAAGWRVERRWVDELGYFSLNLLEARA